MIELLVVLVIVGILSTLVISTHSGVLAKNRNNDRRAAIDSLQGQLETYYAQYGTYPTLGNINDGSWRASNLKTLASDALQDPQWSDKLTSCTVQGQATAATKPVADCYSYQPITSDGSACNNTTMKCAQYTLTAIFEGGGKYVKSSLN